MPRFVARERFSLCGVVDQVLIFGCPMMPLHGLDAMLAYLSQMRVVASHIFREGNGVVDALANHG